MEGRKATFDLFIICQVRGLKTKLGLSSEKVDQLSHSISLKTSEADMVEEKLEGEKRDVDSLRIKFEKEILEKVALKVRLLVLT